jgi:hypothetical protein
MQSPSMDLLPISDEKGPRPVRTRSRICEPAGIFMLTLDCPILRYTHLCMVTRNQSPVLPPRLQATRCSGHTSGASPRLAAYG